MFYLCKHKSNKKTGHTQLYADFLFYLTSDTLFETVSSIYFESPKKRKSLKWPIRTYIRIYGYASKCQSILKKCQYWQKIKIAMEIKRDLKEIPEKS